MAVELEVAIPGLTAYRRGLNKIDKSYGKRIGQINKRAAQKVASNAASRYSALHTRISGRGVKSIRASAAQAAARVKIGSARTPYIVGQEFGSNKYPQFRPWSGQMPGGKGSVGKFLYPAVREETPDLIDAYLKELDDLAREAYPNG